MRWAILVVFCLVIVSIAEGQERLFTRKVKGAYLKSIASEKTEQAFIQNPDRLLQTKSGTKRSDFEVTFVDFPENAKTAFMYAVSIWEEYVSSSVPISVLAKWDTLNSSVIAESKPALSFRTFEGAPVSEVYYPVALAEKLTGENVSEDIPDIICNFNSDAPWYFGTDGNTPANSYDFVTSVLHEITHGLGSYGFFAVEEGIGFFNNVNNLPSIYDYLIFNGEDQRVSDQSLFESPSSELCAQLTSNSLKVNKISNDAGFSETIARVYAPKDWSENASIYHFNESSMNNELMYWETKKGKAIHYPGDKTLEVLNELGWESVSFVFDEIKDFETPCKSLNVIIKADSDVELDISSFDFIYSTNKFLVQDTVKLDYNSRADFFSGEVPLDYYEGLVQYYFQVSSTEDELYKYPSAAPDNLFEFRVGSDYYPPEISHNPRKFVISGTSDLELKAWVTDNIGVDNVKVEWCTDGNSNDFILAASESENIFKGNVSGISSLSNQCQLKYRIVAEDLSSQKNTATNPATGYCSVELFEPQAAKYSYENSFDTQTDDFLLSDFEVSCPDGFTNGNLHSVIPYNISEIENDFYNHYAILKYPIILKEGGLITFDEVVLVEPGEEGTSYEDSYFCDYVIVEGSNDGGKTWSPVTDGYDSNREEDWSSDFSKALYEMETGVSDFERLYKKHTINITDATNFEVGDEVIFRFRLASNDDVNGWGWAIDNLEIQTVFTSSSELTNETNVTIFPNPFSDIINVDFLPDNAVSFQSININILDITGRIVYSDVWEICINNESKKVDLSELQKGIYLVSIRTGSSQKYIQKMIKN